MKKVALLVGALGIAFGAMADMYPYSWVVTINEAPYQSDKIPSDLSLFLIGKDAESGKYDNVYAYSTWSEAAKGSGNYYAIPQITHSDLPEEAAKAGLDLTLHTIAGSLMIGNLHDAPEGYATSQIATYSFTVGFSVSEKLDAYLTRILQMLLRRTLP